MIKPTLTGVTKPAAAKATVADPELRKAAESFEAVLLRQMIGSMRKAKLANDIFGSSASDNFREMADAKTADALSRMNQFGIAKMIEKQLGPAGVKP